MKFNQLNLRSHKSRRRAGRGIAAGRGKTAGRGTKGQKARSGSGGRPYFEGGQTPLVRKLPQLPGFKSLRPEVQIIYTGQLDSLPAQKLIDNHFLAQMNLIKDPYLSVKLIKKGEVKKAHKLQLQAVSKTAFLELQAAGGEFKKVSRLKRPASKTKIPRKAKKKQAGIKKTVVK